MICFVASSQSSKAAIRAPESEPTGICLGIAIRTRASYYPYSGLFCVVEEALDVLSGCVKVIDVFLCRVIGPEKVNAVWNMSGAMLNETA